MEGKQAWESAEEHSGTMTSLLSHHSKFGMINTSEVMSLTLLEWNGL